MNKRTIGGGGIRRSSNNPEIEPSALAMAVNRGVDWKAIKGTGSGGIITMKDIRKASK